MALNTQTLDYELVDLPSDLTVAVIHSGIHRQLADGRYKDRARECAEASARLANTPLCLLSDAQCAQAETLPVPLNRRARHCVSEQLRTQQAIEALKRKDSAELGHLISGSHASLRDDFEISLPEIDALVADAVTLGAYGARLTGGGFGGCIVACVDKAKFETWRTALLQKHPHAQFIC